MRFPFRKRWPLSRNKSDGPWSTRTGTRSLPSRRSSVPALPINRHSSLRRLLWPPMDTDCWMEEFRLQDELNLRRRSRSRREEAATTTNNNCYNTNSHNCNNPSNGRASWNSTRQQPRPRQQRQQEEEGALQLEKLSRRTGASTVTSHSRSPAT